MSSRDDRTIKGSTRSFFLNMGGRSSIACLVLVLACWGGGGADGTSLMKRIRERQNADGAGGTTGDTWIRVVPQSVQDALLSIDDRLRRLDTLKLARLDFSLEQLARRMEGVESRLGRLETKFDLRMERVEEAVSNRELKGELLGEQLTRRVDGLGEKIAQRVAFLEARMDAKASKAMVKLDSLERDLHSSVDEILERLVKGEEKSIALESGVARGEEKVEAVGLRVDGLASFAREELLQALDTNFERLGSEVGELKAVLDGRGNRSEKTLEDIRMAVLGSGESVLSVLRDSSDKIDNLSSSCHQEARGRSGAEALDLERVVTREQMENLTEVLGRALTAHETKFRELDSDVEMYTRKVINGIQELWRTSDELKSDLSSTLEQGSKTREMVRQEFRRLHEQIEPLPKLEPKLTDISEDLDRKVIELSATVDHSFATLLVAQNTFIDSCRRIQEEETHVYDILQQIVYEMRNRSVSDVHKISSELRSQGSEIHRSLAQVLAAVLLTGNVTAAAVRDLLENRCVVLEADGCGRPLGRNASDVLPVLQRREPPIEAMYDAESDPIDRTSDPGLQLQDYEMDYQLSESY